MPANVGAALDTSVMVSAVTVVLTAVVGITVWINKKLLSQRDEFFKLLSEGKERASETESRVKVLEVQRMADKEMIDKVSEELHMIKETLTAIKLQSQANHLRLVDEINGSRSHLE